MSKSINNKDKIDKLNYFALWLVLYIVSLYGIISILLLLVERVDETIPLQFKSYGITLSGAELDKIRLDNDNLYRSVNNNIGPDILNTSFNCVKPTFKYTSDYSHIRDMLKNTPNFINSSLPRRSIILNAVDYSNLD